MLLQCTTHPAVVLITLKPKKWSVNALSHPQMQQRHKYSILLLEHIMCKCSISNFFGNQMTESKARGIHTYTWSTHESYDVAFSRGCCCCKWWCTIGHVFSTFLKIEKYQALLSVGLLMLPVLLLQPFKHLAHRKSYHVFSHLSLQPADDDTFCMCNIKV